MADNTITIALDGEVSLEAFAKLMDGFSDLLRGLSDESGAQLEWVIEDLNVSSAVATARAIGPQQAFQKVLIGYEDVGSAMQSRTQIRHSEKIKAASRKILSIHDARIPSVRLETSRREAIIPLSKTEPVLFPDAVVGSPPAIAAIAPAFGGIKGRIQTLSNRGELRFTLYDTFYDKAVSCYLTEGKEELIRGLWGRVAIVEGLITRDPVTGRPLSIRQVANIVALNEPAGRNDYQNAMGAAPSLSGLSPEDAIRRIRDAQ